MLYWISVREGLHLQHLLHGLHLQHLLHNLRNPRRCVVLEEESLLLVVGAEVAEVVIAVEVVEVVIAVEVVEVAVNQLEVVGVSSRASQEAWTPLMSPSSSPLTPFARALEHVFPQPQHGSWPASPVPTNPSWSATMPNKKVARAPYHYGQSPNPNNWHEAADALRQLKQSRQQRIANQALVKKVETIERLLKEKA